MVDVAHHGHDRRAGLGLDVLLFLHPFDQQRFRIVQLGRDRLVAHFLDHDHRGLLIQHLVDRDHLAELHHLLDDLGRLDRHLVRQFGHGDGFRHVHFTHDRLGRRLEGVAVVVAMAVAAALGATPAVDAAARVATSLQAAALVAARIVLPAAGLAATAALLVAGRRCRRGRSRSRRLLGCGRGTRFAGRLDRLVQRARLLRLLLFGLALGWRLQHARRRIHHFADGAGLGLGRLAALACTVFLSLDLVSCGACLFGGLLRSFTLAGQTRGILFRLAARGFVRRFRCSAGSCGLLFRLLGGEFGLATLLGFGRLLAGAALGFLALHRLLAGLQLGLLARQQFGLTTLFFLAARDFLDVDHRSSDRRRGFRLGRRGTRLIALHQHALFAHLDLHGASLAGGVRLADFAGLALGERDLLARAVLGAAVSPLPDSRADASCPIR